MVDSTHDILSQSQSNSGWTGLRYSMSNEVYATIIDILCKPTKSNNSGQKSTEIVNIRFYLNNIINRVIENETSNPSNIIDPNNPDKPYNGDLAIMEKDLIELIPLFSNNPKPSIYELNQLLKRYQLRTCEDNTQFNQSTINYINHSFGCRLLEDGKRWAIQSDGDFIHENWPLFLTHLETALSDISGHVKRGPNHDSLNAMIESLYTVITDCTNHKPKRAHDPKLGKDVGKFLEVCIIVKDEIIKALKAKQGVRVRFNKADHQLATPVRKVIEKRKKAEKSINP